MAVEEEQLKQLWMCTEDAPTRVLFTAASMAMVDTAPDDWPADAAVLKAANVCLTQCQSLGPCSDMLGLGKGTSVLSGGEPVAPRVVAGNVESVDNAGQVRIVELARRMQVEPTRRWQDVLPDVLADGSFTMPQLLARLREVDPKVDATKIMRLVAGNSLLGKTVGKDGGVVLFRTDGPRTPAIVEPVVEKPQHTFDVLGTPVVANRQPTAVELQHLEDFFKFYEIHMWVRDGDLYYFKHQAQLYKLADARGLTMYQVAALYHLPTPDQDPINLRDLFLKVSGDKKIDGRNSEQFIQFENEVAGLFNHGANCGYIFRDGWQEIVNTYSYTTGAKKTT